TALSFDNRAKPQAAGSAGRHRLELHPARAHFAAGRHVPGDGRVPRLRPAEYTARPLRPAVVGPGEGDPRGVGAGGAVDQVDLAAGVGPAAAVAATHPDRVDRRLLHLARAPGAALRPQFLPL